MLKQISLYLFKSFLIFVAVAFSAQIAVVLADPFFQGKINLIAPVFGVGLGVTLIGGFRYLPAVFIGTMLPPYYAEHAWQLTVGMPMAVLVASWVGYLLLRWLRVNLEFERIRDTFLIIFCGVGVSSFFGALVESLFYLWQETAMSTWAFRNLLLTNWLAAGVGSVIVLPFILTWSHSSGFRMGVRQILEVFVWFATLIVFGLVTFQSWAPTDTLLYPMELAIFPIMAWAAIRFGLRGASAGVLVLALLAAWTLIPVLGPEARYISQSPSNVWIFVGIVSVTSVCLASVMTELRLREIQIVENESRLMAFTSGLPDVAFVISKAGLIEDIFASTAEIRANHRIFNEESARGKPLSELFDNKVADAFLSTVHKALATSRVQTLEYSMESADVGLHWFEARVSPMRATDPAHARVVWVAYNITTRKNVEAAMKQQDTLLNAAAYANSCLLTIPHYKDAISSALCEICHGLGAHRGYVCLVDADKMDEERFPIRYEWVSDAIELDTAPLLDIDMDACFPEWKQRLLTGEALNVLPTTNPFCDAYRERSPLLIPIVLSGQLYGLLGIDYGGAKRTWKESEVNVARVMASSISGIMIIQAREQDLRIARDAADAANTAKSEFLAVMSHEIRTPMNAVLGYTDLLAETELAEAQREQIAIIKRSGKSLLDLINNILDYSKIESRAIDLEIREFELEHTLCEALEICLPMADEKGLELEYKIAENIQEKYLGDGHRIKQVILNLTNNAVKFTKSGGVKINVDVDTRDAEGHQDVLHFRIQDTGIGISEAQVRRLFEAFVQADSSTTRGFGGTGLGLVISKRLVERMNGRIWVETREGSGSVFHVSLPLDHVDGNPLRHTEGVNGKVDDASLIEQLDSKKQLLAEQYPMNILICEDNDVNRQLMCKFLERYGYTPQVACDGREAIERIKKENFEVILMDVRMPDFDGVSVTRMIREREAEHQIPRSYIIAVTAYAMNEDRLNCLNAGMDDYMSKPIEFNVLQSALKRAYEVNQSQV